MTTATTVEYEAVIGLEVHVQLKTRTKMFCGCKVEFGAPANSLTCPVCLGLPGALPVVNKQAIEHGIRIGLALNCQIAHSIHFHRKNYFYPDLPKGYQISQAETPLCFDGLLELPVKDSGGNPRVCRIERAHLEEDAGKSIHLGTATLIDLNRSGTPLVEIVGAPDLRSAEEAHSYLTTLKRNLSYLDVSELSMEKGSLRCDANISIRPVGQEKFGTRAEVKNMNSFKSVASAINFEIDRQKRILRGGGKLHPETRLWDDDKLETRSMRSKEEANDYRFFPEPDLTPFEIGREWVDGVRKSLPEMPERRLLRFLDDYKLARAEAEYLVTERSLGDFFEATVQLYDQPRKIANWVGSELTHALSERSCRLADVKLTPRKLVDLIELLEARKLNNVTAKEVFHAMLATDEEVEQVARRLGKLIDAAGAAEDPAVAAAIAEIIAEFKDKAVKDYLEGKEAALKFLVGQCMRKLKGKVDPKELPPLIEKAARA